MWPWLPAPFEGGAIPLHHRDHTTASVTARVGLGTNNILLAKKAILAGLGYGVMPRWLVAQALAEARLMDILPPWRAPSLTINAAFLPARRQTKRLRVFVEGMAAAVADLDGT